MCIYDPIGADTPNILHPRVDETECGCPEERGRAAHPGGSSLRCYLQLLPLSSLPASLAFLVTTAGSDWTQLLVKLCNVEARRAAGRNSKATQEPETHCAVAKLTEAVQNVPKPVWYWERAARGCSLWCLSS